MLPSAFCARMKALLGEEYPAFLQAMAEGWAEHALRVNTVKCGVADFASPFPVTPIPYTSDGFYHAEEKIGKYPHHHAGMIYSQDPGAMSALASLPELRGARVLDTCAAPGGKSAQLAAAIGKDGVLVANEYVPSRCKLLVGNIERLGIPNALVLNGEVRVLSNRFPDYFDLTLVDAPCSGEGMFRKSADALSMWSEENVRACAARQAAILDDAAATVRGGGYLLYSTCTFSVEENEAQVAAFLARHTDFSLCDFPAAVHPYTAQGFPTEVTDTKKARRFYPHIAPGEGQFMALMRRTCDAPQADTPAYKNAAAATSKQDKAVLSAFFEGAWGDGSVAERVVSLHGNLVLPPDLPLPPTGVFAAGVAIGEIRKGVLFPHHQLFSAYGKRFIRQINLTADDPRTAAYLHGEIIAADGIPNGYAAVLFEGCPLGGAKVVDGMAKNLYPKGLRQ
ncbi:MAG: SAM-dependent methyltransferase [Clostridia bacterium]|nr:SAM-dependent methyltransferase [Clostridia bacterium]